MTFHSSTLILSIVLAGCGGKTALDPHHGDEGGDQDPSDRTCLPPPMTAAEILHPACPERVPDIGDDCQPADLVCAYERCWDTGRPDVIFICLPHGGFFYENVWDCEPNDASCPECLPSEGDACSGVDGTCRYGPGAKAACLDDAWWIWRIERYPLP